MNKERFFWKISSKNPKCLNFLTLGKNITSDWVKKYPDHIPDNLLISADLKYAQVGSFKELIKNLIKKDTLPYWK